METKMFGASPDRSSRNLNPFSFKVKSKHTQRWKSKESSSLRSVGRPRSRSLSQSSSARTCYWPADSGTLLDLSFTHLLNEEDDRYSPASQVDRAFARASQECAVFDFWQWCVLGSPRLFTNVYRPYFAEAYSGLFPLTSETTDWLLSAGEERREVELAYWNILSLTCSEVHRPTDRRLPTLLNKSLQSKVRNRVTLQPHSLVVQSVRREAANRVIRQEHRVEDATIAFRKHPWRTLASIAQHRRKRLHGRLTQSKHKYWLEDIGDKAYIPVDKGYQHDSNISDHSSKQEGLVADSDETLYSLLELFRSDTPVTPEGCASMFFIGPFVRQHAFQQANQANLGSTVYLFQARSNLVQHTHRAVVFKRSKVRGWNQRQKKRCMMLADDGEVLLDAVCLHSFQVMIFSGSWSVVLPPPSTCESEFPALSCTRGGSVRPSVQCGFDSTFAEVARFPDHFTGSARDMLIVSIVKRRRFSGSVSKPENSSLSIIPVDQSVKYGRQGRRRYRTLSEDLEGT